MLPAAHIFDRIKLLGSGAAGQSAIHRNTYGMSMEKRRVLLVDDEPSIVKMVAKRLEMAGYEVLTATDGEDGLTKARIGKPDVIILDLMIPKLSGLEVCTALKQDPAYRHIPIIMFTGKGQSMDEILCREAGANAYINKPHGSQEILEQIEVLLGRMLSDGASSSPSA